MAIATTNPIVENALKACNIQSRYEIEYGNGKKDYVEAYSEEDAKKKRKVMASVYGGFKSVKAENAETAEEQIAKNGRFGVDPEVKRSLEMVKLARQSMSRARDYIGSAEDDDEASGQARDIEKIIKEIDSLIGWLKDYE